MALTEVWHGYMSVLRDVAPITAAAVRPPRSLADRRAAEDATAPWTEELREFYSLHDGVELPGISDRTIGTVLPDLELYGFDAILAAHRSSRESLHDIDDLGLDWPEVIRGQLAGESANRFLDSYVPFAQYADGDFLYVDTRQGEYRGCIREFGWEASDESGPLFSSLTRYIESVRRSVESGTEHSSLTPTIEDGALIWSVDRSSRDVEPQPGPALLHVPFPVVDFAPSEVEPTDEFLDLETVRRNVVEFAISQYPNSIIGPATAVYQRVPRRRGVNVNFFVPIDSESKMFLTIATGVADDVLIHEVPSEGFQLVHERGLSAAQRTAVVSR